MLASMEFVAVDIEVSEVEPIGSEVESLPDFPEAGQFDDDAGVDDWLLFASYTLGRTIALERWEKLKGHQQGYVRRSLHSRGLDVWAWTCYGQLVVVPDPECPVAIHAGGGGPVSYGMPAGHLRNAETISIVVHEQNLQRASAMLAEFLSDLGKAMNRHHQRTHRPVKRVVPTIAEYLATYHANNAETTHTVPLALALLEEKFGPMPLDKFTASHFATLYHSLALVMEGGQVKKAIETVQRFFKAALMAKHVTQPQYKTLANASMRVQQFASLSAKMALLNVG